MRISHEAIYQALFIQGRGALKRELVACLRTGRALRVPRARARQKAGGHVTPELLISERPAEADGRAVPGHWEGDLIIGAGNQSAIATLVERSSRYLVLGHLGAERTAEVVRDSLIAAVTELPGTLRRTLTWDQGAEMAEHRSFTMATDMRVYFAEPGAPWQRGTNLVNSSSCVAGPS